MSSKIGDKTPAQLHNDLFFLNNNNLGIDSTLRSIYSGAGTATPIKVSTSKVEADFGGGSLINAVTKSNKLFVKDIGDVALSFTVNTSDGNLQKVRLTGDAILTIVSDISDEDGFEFTLLVEQYVGSKSITLPVSCKTPSDASISFSSTAGAIDIIKFITYNGGDTWLVWKIASDVR